MRFTWTTKQLGSVLLLERLDRAYVSASWPTLFPNHIVYHEPIPCSNNVAIIYATYDHYHDSKRPYQIESWRLHSHPVVAIIKEDWSLYFNESLMFVIHKKTWSSSAKNYDIGV